MTEQKQIRIYVSNEVYQAIKIESSALKMPIGKLAGMRLSGQKLPRVVFNEDAHYNNLMSELQRIQANLSKTGEDISSTLATLLEQYEDDTSTNVAKRQVTANQIQTEIKAPLMAVQTQLDKQLAPLINSLISGH